MKKYILVAWLLVTLVLGVVVFAFNSSVISAWGSYLILSFVLGVLPAPVMLLLTRSKPCDRRVRVLTSVVAGLVMWSVSLFMYAYFLAEVGYALDTSGQLTAPKVEVIKEVWLRIVLPPVQQCYTSSLCSCQAAERVIGTISWRLYLGALTDSLGPGVVSGVTVWILMKRRARLLQVKPA